MFQLAIVWRAQRGGGRTSIAIAASAFWGVLRYGSVQGSTFDMLCLLHYIWAVRACQIKFGFLFQHFEVR